MRVDSTPTRVLWIRRMRLSSPWILVSVAGAVLQMACPTLSACSELNCGGICDERDLCQSLPRVDDDAGDGSRIIDPRPDGGSSADGGLALRVGIWNIEWFGDSPDGGNGPADATLQRENVAAVLNSSGLHDVDIWGCKKLSASMIFNC